MHMAAKLMVRSNSYITVVNEDKKSKADFRA